MDLTELQDMEVSDAYRRMVVRMSIVVSACLWMMLPGCSKTVSPLPIAENQNPPVDVSPPSAPSTSIANVAPAKVPVVKKRSAEALRDRVRATVERMQADAEPRRRRQAMHRVAQALLDYEKQHGHFPPGDGRANEVESTGLSWRVHLLPFLDETALHREFHLDESWDSPHNMALVGRMPKVFGDDALGLTPLFRPIDQVATNNVLVVAVPEDASEFWTQPGGFAATASTIPERMVLRDGRLLAVKSSVSPAAWQTWWQSSRGLQEWPAWLESIPLPSKTRPVVADSGAIADLQADELMGLPAETWCAVHLKPRRLLSHPLRAALFRTVAVDTRESSPASFLPTWLGSYGSQIRSGVAWLRHHQMELEELESLTIVIPRKIFEGPVHAAESFAVVCRAADVFNVEAVLEAEMATSRGFQYREQGTTTGIVDVQQSLAVHFANERTLLLGGQSLLLSLSDARLEDSRLTTWIRQAGTAPLVMAMSAEPIQQMLKQRPVPFPPPLQEWVPFVIDAQGLVFSFDPDADTLAELTISFRQSSSAEQLKSRLLKQLEGQHAGLTSRAHAHTSDPVGDRLSALIAGLQMEATGELLHVTIKRPADFDALIQSLLKVAP